MYPIEVAWEHVGVDKDKWWATVGMVMYFSIP
jgi:hypothetical protein